MHSVLVVDSLQYVHQSTMSFPGDGNRHPKILVGGSHHLLRNIVPEPIENGRTHRTGIQGTEASFQLLRSRSRDPEQYCILTNRLTLHSKIVQVLIVGSRYIKVRLNLDAGTT